MPLPYSTDNIEEIAQEHRGLYVEREGKYFLDVEGHPAKEPGASNTDPDVVKRVVELEKIKAKMERDLFNSKRIQQEKEQQAVAAEAKNAEVGKRTRDLLRAIGHEIPDDDEADAAAELQKRLRQIEEEKREAEKAAILRERDAAKIEGAIVRALAGKAQDVDYALYRARALDSFAEVKVENGKVVGVDALLEALAEAEVIGKDEDDKPDAPKNVAGQTKLQKGSKVWRDAKDWPAFLALPVNVQLEAREKDPDFVRSLERRFYGAL